MRVCSDNGAGIAFEAVYVEPVVVPGAGPTLPLWTRLLAGVGFKLIPAYGFSGLYDDDDDEACSAFCASCATVFWIIAEVFGFVLGDVPGCIGKGGGARSGSALSHL